MPLLIFLLVLPFLAAGDPQTTKLVVGCSPYKAIVASFPSIRNSTFSELRSIISNSSSHFATAERWRYDIPIYALFLCRDYLIRDDCLSCFSAAVADILTCGLADGARAVLDGCFLRYEGRHFFYDEVSDPGNAAVCGNHTDNATGFGDEARTLSRDLSIATPKVDGYFAAASRGGVFAVAQCVETGSTSRCADCLAAAVENLKSCLPNADGRAVDAMCFMRYSDVNFYGSYPTVALDSLLDSPGDSRGTAAVIGGVAGGVGVLLLLMLVLILILWRRTREVKKARRDDVIFVNKQLSGEAEENDVDLPIFDFDTIATATNYFSPENKLGEGGFGPVYKGHLGESLEIAVKRLAKTSQQGTDEFKNEAKLIAKLQHRNLVQLLGCCIHGEERILIYEYMPNKSLDAFLFDKEKCASLEWNTRYQIIVGITRGLLYLHHDSRLRIIHRDLKAGNILLDKEMNPKISDFGMARIFGGDQTDFNTRKVVGTYGYMSPEYAMDGIFSMKSDVYSFGVLVLEIISGRRNRGAYTFSPHLNLVAHSWSLWNEGKILQIVHESMWNDAFLADEAMKCIKVSLLCVQERPEDRPLMSSVVVMLGSASDIASLPQPKQPGFIACTGPEEWTEGSPASNGLTVSMDVR